MSANICACKGCYSPCTNVVPLTGKRVAFGSPSSGVYPNGLSSIPAKMIARRTAMPMVIWEMDEYAVLSGWGCDKE